MKADKYELEKTVITAASTAASRATLEMIKENPEQWYPCGFAWVMVKPANCRLANALKEMEIGSTDTYEGGYRISNPSGNSTQWMDAKYVGAQAFVDEIKKQFPNQRIYAVQRID